MFDDSKLPIAIGIAAFAATWIFAAILSGPIVCSDGWASSSAGQRGACSSHGGVNRNSGGFSFLLSIIAGIAAYAATKRISPKVVEAGGITNAIREARRVSRERSEIETGSCPVCGAAMSPATQNKREGMHGWMLICSRFPACRGFVDLPVQPHDKT